MILAWLKGESSERKVALGILNELMFYTKEVGVEEQELIVKWLPSAGVMRRKLEGSTDRFSNTLCALLSDRRMEDEELSRLMNILDYRVAFNSESFRECVLAKRCGLFEIVMSRLIDDVCVCVCFCLMCCCCCCWWWWWWWFCCAFLCLSLLFFFLCLFVDPLSHLFRVDTNSNWLASTLSIHF